jgi:hypothetical protein
MNKERKKNKYRIEISSTIYITLEADDEEDARIIASQSPEYGDKLLNHATIGDAELIGSKIQ